MLAMARALMIDPVAVILDEPTAGLSPAYTAVVWEQIQQIVASGTAAIVVEQNVESALRHAGSVYVLVAGTNHVHGPAAEIAQLDLGAIFLGHDPGRGDDSHQAVIPIRGETCDSWQRFGTGHAGSPRCSRSATSMTGLRRMRW